MSAEPRLPLDLAACEREPIRTPGAIQPFGALLVLREPELRVAAASENLAAIAGVAPDDALDRELGDVVGTAAADALEASIGAGRLDEPVALRLAGKRVEARLHRRPPFALVELEPDPEPGDGGALLALRRIVTRLRDAVDLAALGEIVVEEVRALGGFDRVMLYRFDRNWHGEVAHERAAPNVEPYLGLRYPASDIPAQARELYRTNWVRYIPDVAYAPAAIVPARTVGGEGPLDLGDVALRSVSPVHLEYLRNMGVAATLTISLLVGGRLWGLVACHHRTPRRLAPGVRAAAEFVGRTVSFQLEALERTVGLREALARRETRLALVAAADAAGEIGAGLASRAGELLGLVGAGGAAVRFGGTLHLVGATPARARVEALASRLALERAGSGEPLDVEALGALDPSFADVADVASGVLALELAPGFASGVIWFRPELLREVTWGGDPEKSVEIDPATGRIAPRRSFARWREIQRGRARPWEPYEIEAARALGGDLGALSARRAEELARENVTLAASNTELDAFAQLASHDLREPLRGIHNYASYLVEDYADVLDAAGRERLQTLLRLTVRMDGLIEALLELARVAGIALAERPSDLRDVARDVVALFGPRLEARGATVEIAPDLPRVRADGTLVGEIYNNLISNALKYSEREHPRIELGVAERRTADDGRTMATLFVRDDGIGIREKHREAIFTMFRRLHAGDAYGGGSGAGLAIARRIVERHGGAIWVTSAFGAGSTFYFTLPEDD